MILSRWVRAGGIAARNAALGGNLLSLSLVPDPNRFHGYIAQCILAYRSVADKRGIPQKHVFDILAPGDGATITLPRPLGGNLWFSGAPSLAVDIMSLCLLCQAIRPRRIFEIGTFDGYSTAALAMNSPPDAVVYTLDLPGGKKGTLETTVVDRRYVSAHSRVGRKTWEGTAAAGKVVQLYGDSAVFDFAPYRANIDLFFVDGAHSYEYVQSDTKNALLCTHPGSIIAWHDFGKSGVNGVQRVVSQLAGGGRAVVVPGGSLAYLVV
jgi:predicted O-methyltransferase YrrM